MPLSRDTFNIRRQIKSKRMEIDKPCKMIIPQIRNHNIAMLKSQKTDIKER